MVNLSNIRGVGVTTFEIDNTQSNQVQNQVPFEERLIIGFSRTGPFNSVVRLTSVSDRERVFGPIDSFLEQRGSFFHRSLDIALAEGPVLALNLLPLNNDLESGDFVDYKSLSTSLNTNNAPNINYLYSAFYDKERFWKASESNFSYIINENTLSRNSILNFVNLSKNKYSILIKKSSNTSKFKDVSVKSYYKNEVPFYINPDDYISDYFVDIIVLKGDFTNYQNLSTDPIYSKYFTKNGLKKSAIASIQSSTDFRVVLSATACLLPDIIDGNQLSYSIDETINRYTNTTELFCYLNTDYLNSLSSYDLNILDLVGHSLVQDDFSKTEIDFLSYKFTLIENLQYNKLEEFVTTPVDTIGTYQNTLSKNNAGLFSNRLLLEDVDVQANLVVNHSVIQMNNGGKFGLIKNYSTSSGNTYISIEHTDKSSEGSFYYRVLSANATALVLEGTHEDLDYAMDSEYIQCMNSINKVYLQIDSYDIDSPNNQTIIFTSSDNIDLINSNYKATWSAGYKINSSNTTSNTVVFKGSWDLQEFDFHGDTNTLYLKNNSGKTGYVVYDDYEIINGETSITLTDAKIKYLDNTESNLISTGTLSELTSDNYYITFGAHAITRPSLVSNVAEISFEADSNYILDGALYAHKGSQIYKDYKNGILTSGDIFYDELIEDYETIVKKYYIGIQDLKDNNSLEVIKINAYTDEALTNAGTLSYGNKKYIDVDEFENVNLNEIVFSSKVDSLNRKIEIDSTFDNLTRIRLTSTNGDLINVGDLVNSQTVDVNGNVRNLLSKVITKKKVIISNVVYYDIIIGNSAKITIDSSRYYIEKYTNYDSFVNEYNLFSLSGFTLNDYHLPGSLLNKLEQQAKILNTIEDTNLIDTLADRNLIDYMYIVDTFDSLVTNGLYPKNILSRLAKKQGKSIALVNAPSIEEFSKTEAPQPIFRDGFSQKRFSAEYLPDGGNLLFSPEYTFSFPSIDDGSKYCIPVGPNFKYLKENGQIISLPAAVVLSNLLKKKNSTLDRYDSPAGTTRGIVRDPRILDVEYFSMDSLEYLKQIGYNPFMNIRGYGITFYGNFTAYSDLESALSKLHIRDNLNAIERIIEKILDKYIWDDNTPKTRIKVYEDINAALYPLKNKAFYDYTIKIDDTNNTSATINASFGILEVSITPTRAIENFVNILTINKGSGITASGFII